MQEVYYRAQAFYKKLKFEKVGIGPVLKVGKDNLSSSILVKDLSDFSFARNEVKESNDDA